MSSLFFFRDSSNSGKFKHTNDIMRPPLLPRFYLHLSKTVSNILQANMLQTTKNIARCVIVGFLLLAVSGLTVAIHHVHNIADANAVNGSGHSRYDGIVIKSTPSTYHEVHVLTFLSGDSFTGSSKIDIKTSLVKLFTESLNFPELLRVQHTTSLATTEKKDGSPLSVDKCALLCSFLI